jgi:hypothetical protein
MPVNQLLIQSLRKMYSYYGDDFTVECPTVLLDSEEVLPKGYDAIALKIGRSY